MKIKSSISNTNEPDKNTQKANFFCRLLFTYKHPACAGITLTLAVIFFIISAILPNYAYRSQGGTVQLENPEHFATSETGWTAIADGRDSIYCLDDKKQLIYTRDIHDFPYENIEILDVTFDSDNHLYCHIAVYNDDAYLTDAEAVFELDPNGTILREILYYDYRNTENPPSHQVRIMGLHSYNEQLYYLYKEDSGYSLIQCNPDNPAEDIKTTITRDGYSEIIKCHSNPEGTFLVLGNNGEIGTISLTGEYSLLYKAAYDIRTAEGIFPYDVLMTEDALYMLAGQKELTLYKWNGNDWDILFPIKENIPTSENTDLLSCGLGILDKTPALHINDTLYLLDNPETLTPFNAKLTLPATITLCMWLQDVLPAISGILLLLGIVSLVGNLMKWRFSILSKQLLSTIPLVFLLLAVVIITMLISMINLNTDDILRETIAINEIAAAQFDGNELETITGFQQVDNGQVAAINNRLRELVNGNQSYWSRNYNLAIFTRTTGENFVCIANSDGSNQFMMNNFATDAPIDQAFYEDSHTFASGVSYGTDTEQLQLILVTPVYKEDGSYNAIMVLYASQDYLIKEIVSTGKQLLLYTTLLVALLILVISLVAAYNAKTLRQAQAVITQIAGGDFTLRAKKYSKDEIGEICIGVNNMADRLEEYINEKDRNEKFYYKFVPEKFRELLHKEKFTDLSLGDAQSADLSILFCDIRGFSLNSEMMTATESFDFVNRIYGKAGPIIRKHNGFIDKYIGDAIMALFESADDAVAAGIELYHAIVQNPNAEADFGIPSVKVGIGIHSGMARIGIVGENERMSGTVISNTVNLSSRIESLTKRYGTGMIISKDTLDRLKNPDALSTRYLGMVQVAGVNEVAGLYEILDCLEEDRRENLEQNKELFRKAVRLFHMGDLQQSMEMFQTLTNQNPEDKAAPLYYQYIQEKLMRGDSEHNVFRFVNK